MSSQVNKLGDQFIFTFNAANNYIQSANLETPILGQKFFRIAAGANVKVQVPFVQSIYELDEASSTFIPTTTIPIGFKTIWYKCGSDSIQNFEIKWIREPNDPLDYVSGSFQFLPYLPKDYVFSS